MRSVGCLISRHLDLVTTLLNKTHHMSTGVNTFYAMFTPLLQSLPIKDAKGG